MSSRRSGSPGLLSALSFCVAALACAGPDTTAPDPLASPEAPSQRFVLHVHDLLVPGKPRVTGGTVLLDGVAHPMAGGTLSLALAPGPHALAVRHSAYRPDLLVLRVPGERGPRAQAAGANVLRFDLRPGDAQAELMLVGRNLDVPFFLSLLDGGLSRRWRGTVDLHIDLSPTPSRRTLPPERTDEIASFVRSALEEISAGSLMLGQVTTGTGLTWKDFEDRERPGAITLQFWDELRGRDGAVGGWALYREEPRLPGVIRSANMILDLEILRLGRDFRPYLGHELGHALSLQHPLPCRRWSRMDAGVVSCRAAPAVEAHPERFWSEADRVAGKLLHTFLPGTDFSRLPAVPPGS